MSSVTMDLLHMFATFYRINSLTLLGDLLDERTAVVDGYNSYFSFSRGRSGYSGNVS